MYRKYISFIAKLLLFLIILFTWVIDKITSNEEIYSTSSVIQHMISC